MKKFSKDKYNEKNVMGVTNLITTTTPIATGCSHNDLTSNLVNIQNNSNTACPQNQIYPKIHSIIERKCINAQIFFSFPKISYVSFLILLPLP